MSAMPPHTAHRAPRRVRWWPDSVAGRGRGPSGSSAAASVAVAARAAGFVVRLALGPGENPVGGGRPVEPGLGRRVVGRGVGVQDPGSGPERRRDLVTRRGRTHAELGVVVGLRPLAQSHPTSVAGRAASVRRSSGQAAGSAEPTGHAWRGATHRRRRSRRRRPCRRGCTGTISRISALADVTGVAVDRGDRRPSVIPALSAAEPDCTPSCVATCAPLPCCAVAEPAERAAAARGRRVLDHADADQRRGWRRRGCWRRRPSRRSSSRSRWPSRSGWRSPRSGFPRSGSRRGRCGSTPPRSCRPPRRCCRRAGHRSRRAGCWR